MSALSLLVIGILSIILIGAIGSIYIIRMNWKRYGLLFLLSALTAVTLCFTFVAVGLYSFPMNVLHGNHLIPYGVVALAFPFLVLLGVRYSPEQWIWKIPFYWAIIHLGVLGEVILLYTPMLQFHAKWDLWDSYTLWWVYLLLFEALGGKLIPSADRRPLDVSLFRYGRWAWIIVHVILISTIFLAGVYVGANLL